MSSYLLPVPEGHRTDWGEAFAVALEERLQELSPAHLDLEKSGISVGRGGSLVIRLQHADCDEQIEVDLWEDQAVVRYDAARRTFELPRGRSSENWIPQAADFVCELLAGRVETRTVTFGPLGVRRRTRTSFPGDNDRSNHQDDAPRAATRSSDPGEKWSGPSYL